MTEKRKIQDAGGSLSVTLPKDFSESNDLKPGQEVWVIKNRKSILYTTDPEIAAELEEPIHRAAEKSLKRHLKEEQKA